jgi:hypothetical protein
MALIKMLVDLEQAGVVVEAGVEGLAKRRQRLAGDDNDRAMHLDDFAYRRFAPVFAR